MLDYSGERTADAMESFALGHMPDFVERVKSLSDLDRVKAKAEKVRLPLVFVVGGGAQSQLAASLKSLSAEFRRRILVAKVATDSKLVQALSVKKKKNAKEPVIFVSPPPYIDSDRVLFDKKKSFNQLSSFFPSMLSRSRCHKSVPPRRQNYKTRRVAHLFCLEDFRL